MPLEVQTFFQGFNFDTLLAIISCITGIIALFVGGAAYNQCQINKKSFNDKKEFEDQSQDHSQKAGRDIINNCDTTALANLTAASFETSLKLAYAQFEQKTTDNLHQIINETRRIIEENSIQLGAYTKIDWINVYFENAKNTSDTYMQNIWAKVLAKELSFPGSFSFKTLDVLKNMSSEDFRLFEELASFRVNDTIIADDSFKLRFVWTKCIKMQEMGLMSLDGSQNTLTLSPKKEQSAIVNKDTMLLSFSNTQDNIVEITYQVYLLTNAAKELLDVCVSVLQDDFYIELANTLKKKWKQKAVITLRKVERIGSNQIRYLSEDLTKENNM